MSTQTLLEIAIPTIVIGLTIAIPGPFGRNMFWALDPKLQDPDLPDVRDRNRNEGVRAKYEALIVRRFCFYFSDMGVS